MNGPEKKVNDFFKNNHNFLCSFFCHYKCVSIYTAAVSFFLGLMGDLTLMYQIHAILILYHYQRCVGIVLMVVWGLTLFFWNYRITYSPNGMHSFQIQITDNSSAFK